MDADTIQQNIQLYTLQLNQVETALQASVPDENLIQLRADLKELISLTEENLLALRKRQLLSELEASDDEQPNLNSSSQSSNAKDMDAEYAAFKALIDDGESTSGTSEKGPQSENSQVADCSSNVEREDEGTNSSEGDDEGENKNLTESLKSLIGKKCRAPFNTEWSMYGTHNAIITDVLDFNPPDPAQILVMFSNPTHRAMVPCQYFLNGKCKFSDEKCNFSHGHIIKLDEIKPYEEPDYSSLQINGKCLARFTDKLWYRAKVESIEADGRFVVSFEIKNDVLVVSHEEIMPFSEQSKETPSEVSTSDSESDDDEGNASAIIKYIAPKTTQAMGEWEAHTKGFGSRIMAKMGYIVGQGLGKNGEGKAEPVPIEVLPSGKSLDTIMMLKEQAANKDLFSAFNNEKKKQKKIEQRNKNAYNKPENTNVFDFINNRLSQRKDGSGSSSSGKKKHHQSGHDSTNKDTKHISLKDLSKKSDRTLNVQHMKTEGELRRVEKEILRLKDSILRNEDKNKSIVKQLELKIAGLENYKKQLQVSETAIGQQKKQRSDHKKLTIF